MSDDIVERLRAEVAYDELDDGWSNMMDVERLHHDAAEEIVRLRARNERLTALLDERLPNWRTYR